MALLKLFETPQGVDATYHKIVKAEINAATQLVTVWVQVYASAEAREAHKDFLWMEYVNIPFSALTQDPRDLLYPMVANFGDSYLKGGETDAEGSQAPGNFEINLTPSALEPTPLPVIIPPVPLVPVIPITPSSPEVESPAQHTT